MSEEKPQPSQAYYSAKEQLRQASTAFAQAKFAYDTIKLEYEALEDQIDTITNAERQALNTAEETYRKAEQNRKACDDKLKATDKSDLYYKTAKEVLQRAQETKKQAKQEKDQASEQLNLARKPHESRFATLINRKEELKTAFELAKANFDQALKTYSNICQQEFAREDASTAFDGEMTLLAEEIIQIRQQINLLSGWEEIATDILRQFVGQNPTGLTNGDLKEGKSYPFWINLTETLLGKLIDNPRHTVSFDKLVSLIGIQKALGYIEKIARSKVEKDFKSGALHHKDDDHVLSVTDLDAITDTKFTTPRLILCHLGQLKLSDIGLLLTPAFLKTSLQEMESNKEIPTGTSEVLEKEGITDIRQLLQKGLREVSSTLGQTGQQVISALWKKVSP
ncbi:MAG: hypothetical protein PHN19_04095 [Patescibacteria group bacterium]|nr:hypothetical protein [Patescibacteria group bacterium]